MIRTIFQQAIIADYPAALRHIRTEGINLAVWKDPLSPDTKAYLKNLNLQKLVENNTWNDNYWTYASGKPARAVLKPNDGVLAEADNLEKIRTFCDLLPSPEEQGSLPADILKLTKAFANAVECEKVGFNMLVFRPSNKTSFWHTDVKTHRGIITLKGDIGTIWRPDSTLPETNNRTNTYWGDVEPDDPIQNLLAQDFAVFRCQGSQTPLVHATPPKYVTQKQRLALLMSPNK